MSRRFATIVAGLLAAGSLVLLPRLSSMARQSDAPEVQTNPIVTYDDYHDVSLPVRDYPAELPLVPRQREEREIFRKIIPGAMIAHPDLALQRITLTKVSATIGLNFDGPADVDGDAPPDTNASVGATQVVLTQNTSYQVFNKTTGASELGPKEISSIWSGFSGTCGLGATGFYSDPIVEYDKAAGRWLVTILGSNNGFATGVECIAVSKTNDATGSYNRYSFSFGNSLNDYPKFGVWPDAYYANYNIFGAGAADACAYDRNAMLAGNTAKSVCFQRTTADFSFLPSDLDGATQPASGEPNFFLELFTGTTLHFFKFHVNFTNPSSSTFTGPTTITVTSYTQACAATGTCIKQSGTSTQLDSLGDRLMHRLAYRNFGDHEALVVTHSVNTTNNVAGVRWYEIRSPNTTPVVFQSGTFKTSGTSLWMGSAGMDKVGDIAVGFSESSGTIHPSIQYTGRVPTDPVGTLESAATIISGPGSQNAFLSRWGDYSSIAIDPGDDCTFWYANEYLPKTGSFNWHTRLASLKFPTCK